jgi:hypothetical protein
MGTKHWCNDTDKKNEVPALQKTPNKMQLEKPEIKPGTSCTYNNTGDYYTEALNIEIMQMVYFYFQFCANTASQNKGKEVTACLYVQ